MGGKTDVLETLQKTEIAILKKGICHGKKNNPENRWPYIDSMLHNATSPYDVFEFTIDSLLVLRFDRTVIESRSIGRQGEL